MQTIRFLPRDPRAAVTIWILTLGILTSTHPDLLSYPNFWVTLVAAFIPSLRSGCQHRSLGPEVWQLLDDVHRVSATSCRSRAHLIPSCYRRRAAHWIHLTAHPKSLHTPGQSASIEVIRSCPCLAFDSGRPMRSLVFIPISIPLYSVRS